MRDCSIRGTEKKATDCAGLYQLFYQLFEFLLEGNRIVVPVLVIDERPGLLNNEAHKP